MDDLKNNQMNTEYDNLTKEQLIKVCVGLRDRNFRTQNELNTIKNNLTLWERKHFENFKREIGDIKDPGEFECVNCKLTISPVRATQIFKGKPYCADCICAFQAEINFSKRPEERGIQDYITEK